MALLLTRAALRSAVPHAPIARNHASTALCNACPVSAAPLITSVSSISVCERIWGQEQQQSVPIRAFLIHGSPAQPTELKTLQLDSLAPTNLTKAAVGEFLMQQLKSRPAAQQQVHAAVLSAPYLPSQLAEITSLAASLQLHASFWHEAEHGLHVLLSRSPQLLILQDDDDLQQHGASVAAQPATAATEEPLQLQLQQLASWRPVLAAAFGTSVYPLRESQLQAARHAEQQLMRQLQLWDATAWNQQLLGLMARRATRHYFAVNSLMGPQGLQAVRSLVAKHPGLVLKELPSSSSSSSPEPPAQPQASPRTRRGSRALRQAAAAAAAAAAGDSKGGGGLVLVVSRGELSPEQLANLPPDAFTDYVQTADSPGSGRSDTVKPRAKSPMRRLFELAHDIATMQQQDGGRGPQQQ